MRKTLIALATLSALASLTACSDAPQSSANTNQAASTSESTPTAAVQTESQRLNAWFEQKYEYELLKSPIMLTYLGRTEHQDSFGDLSMQAYKEGIERTKANLAELKTEFNYDALDENTQIAYDYWVYQSEQEIKADEFAENSYIFDQMTAVHSSFPQILIALHDASTERGIEDYLLRISATGEALDQLIEASKHNASKGVRPPYFAFDAVINESRKIISGAPFDEGDDSAIWADAKSKLANLVEQGIYTQEQADSMLESIKSALLFDFKPGYERLIAWQLEDQPNATEQALGAGELPNGQAYYNERLANQTTTTLNADEVHEIGLKEVARLRGEMESIKTEFGFEGTLAEFFVFLRDTKDDERLYYPNTEEGRQGYIDDATAAINRIKAVLPEYFGILPKADMVVKRVEAFREQDGAAQHYSPSTPDGSRPGVYYAHLSDMTAMPKRELEVIAYHEGLPGHHMQIAISLELENVPSFIKQTYLPAYGEGWALYSEWLAKEMPGTYQDPLSEFGRLGSEIWRAIRLVVDTGLHAKGWSEQQAIDYFKANSAVTSAQAESEVRRYLVLPGQATSYKIGMLKIQELRARAEEQLGDKFDIRMFHDTVLGGGALPLTILERKVDNWIASVKA
ncbi:DUF885 domain-containing protein [Glaciecola siphonariae]|uniref:DUF885 domain-containing protein n=1 Tax=Glaciecola siphonariae TaxID=521012 RepID=A0ABV9LRV3_9ALTE